MTELINSLGHFVLFADSGKVLMSTDGATTNIVESITPVDASTWTEVDAPPIPEDEEATIEDYEAALAEVGV